MCRRTIRPKAAAVLLLLATALSGCGAEDSDDDDDSTASGSGTGTGSTGSEADSSGGSFPNFYTLAINVAPSVTSDSDLSLKGGAMALGTFPTTYESDTSEFSTAFSLEQNFIGQVLNDAGISGPVKSIYVLLAQVQSTLTKINSNYSDDSGEEENCTAITADSLTTPFFDAANTFPFNGYNDNSKYKCYVSETDSFLAFGRHAVADAADSCTDAYEYYATEGYGSDDGENTEQVAERGSTVDVASIKKFYYNGCTKDLKLYYAQTTLYAAGVEFSSRSELSGNVTDRSFSLRSHFIDAAPSYATHNTFVGHGVSKKDNADDSDVHFIFGYRSDNCGNSSDSSTCTEGTAKSFCVKNAGTGVDFSLESDGSKCETHESGYEGLTILERSELPSGYFEVSASAFGF